MSVKGGLQSLGKASGLERGVGLQQAEGVRVWAVWQLVGTRAVLIHSTLHCLESTSESSSPVCVARQPDGIVKHLPVLEVFSLPAQPISPERWPGWTRQRVKSCRLFVTLWTAAHQAPPSMEFQASTGVGCHRYLGKPILWVGLVKVKGTVGCASLFWTSWETVLITEEWFILTPQPAAWLHHVCFPPWFNPT